MEKPKGARRFPAHCSRGQRWESARLSGYALILQSSAFGVAHSSETLKDVKSTPHKNVTLSLPVPLLRRFRIYAASRNQSMTELMTEAIRRMIDQEGDTLKADQRFLDRIRNVPDRGTHGVIRWTRGELHER